MSRQVEVEFAELKNTELKLPEKDIAAITAYFAPPELAPRPEGWASLAQWKKAGPPMPNSPAGCTRTCSRTNIPDYGMVTISLKPIGGIPGDATAVQMEAVADIAEEYAFDEIRVSHEQNLILPHVALDDLPADLSPPRCGRPRDGQRRSRHRYHRLPRPRLLRSGQRPLDPRRTAISLRFGAPERQAEIGELKIKISGCINACGHHHVGHIGMLGVEKKGEELYQITLGGSGDENTSIGEIIGRGFEPEKVTDAVEVIVNTYLGLRLDPSEIFLDAYRRVGPQPFKDALYGDKTAAAA
jgi:sulfite reductase (NADPH) hemoprotein beta-component